MNKEKINIVNLNNFVVSIRDFNGIKIALYKTEDGGAQVISQGPDGDWTFSESISIADVMNSPPGYYISYGGQFESQATAQRNILILSIFSLLGMFLALYTNFRSVSLSLQVMLAIPLSFIGAVIGIYMTGGVFSIATMVGFVTLTGIASRNGIMMISHYLHLMKYEGEKFDLQMLKRGTQERLVPVLMTALTALLALTPLVMAAGETGKEILSPVAIVIFSCQSFNIIDQQ